MQLHRLHPELRNVYRRIPAVPFHNRLFLALLSLVQKLQRGKITPCDGVSIEDRVLGAAGVRIYRPLQGATGAGLLWIHGGGYVIGAASTNDRECAALAGNLGLVVVSVEYRLAPKYPFPLPLDDCFAAWHFMLKSAEALGIDRERIAITGQSAGGGLAAALAQRIADDGGVQPAAQLLTYPMLDDRTALREELDAVRHRLWNNKNNRGAWGFYLGCDPGSDSLPEYAAPGRREDLSGLPPTWIAAGDLDLFYDEDCRYAERLREAGVPCEFHTVQGAPHGFDLLAPEAGVSRAFNAEYSRFLRESLKL